MTAQLNMQKCLTWYTSQLRVILQMVTALLRVYSFPQVVVVVVSFSLVMALVVAAAAVDVAVVVVVEDGAAVECALCGVICLLLLGAMRLRCYYCCYTSG